MSWLLRLQSGSCHQLAVQSPSGYFLFLDFSSWLQLDSMISKIPTSSTLRFLCFKSGSAHSVVAKEQCSHITRWETSQCLWRTSSFWLLMLLQSGKLSLLSSMTEHSSGALHYSYGEIWEGFCKSSFLNSKDF